MTLSFYADCSFYLSLLYFLMSFVAGFQLLRTIYYRYRLISYNFGFLLCCAVWGLVRGIFFLCLPEWNNFDVLFLILYWFPIGIQFTTFSLLAVFFCQQVYRDSWKNTTTRTVVLSIFTFMNAVFYTFLLVYWILSAVLSPEDGTYYTNPNGDYDAGDNNPPWLDELMQAFSGVVFLALVVFLGYFGFRVFILIRNKEIAMPFHLQGASNNLILAATFLVVIIFTIRSFYDFITMFGIFNIPISTGHEPADFAMMFFYIILEITPAAIVLVLFFKLPQSKKGKPVKMPPTKSQLSPESTVNNFMPEEGYHDSIGAYDVYTSLLKANTDGDPAYAPYAVSK